MPDFRLSEKAWAAASKELRAIGRHPSDDDRLLIELSCDIYVRCHRAIGRPFSPDKHAEAWRAVSKKADGLLRAIDCLREVGAAELEFLGYEMAKTIRGNLSDLSSAALVVAEIEANGPRIPQARPRPRSPRQRSDGYLASEHRGSRRQGPWRTSFAVPRCDVFGGGCGCRRSTPHDGRPSGCSAEARETKPSHDRRELRPKKGFQFPIITLQF